MSLRQLNRGRQISRYPPKINNPQSSLQTSTSNSPRDYQPHHKQKVELCRKFIEYGYCPYDNKCKFAHGSHELRANCQLNSRYKTKHCVSYFKNGYCHYGNRCNFLHAKQPTFQEQSKWNIINTNFRQILEESRTSSRMLKLFQ